MFDDVRLVVEEKTQSHFIGSIVLKKNPTIDGLPQFLLIDGQQRTITIVIYLNCIMFWMRKYGMNDECDGMMSYLIAKNDKADNIVMVTSENHGSLENIIKAITDLDENTAKQKTVNSLVDTNLLNRADKNIGNG